MICVANSNAKRTAVIGLGRIFAKYQTGLTQSQTINVVALLDQNENPPSRNLVKEIPFYNDWQKMIDETKPQLIVISTPPKSHYYWIKKAFDAGIDVIVEKPMVTEIGQIDELYLDAKNNARLLCTAYHWQTGEEVAFFNERFHPSLISEIEIKIFDPYSDNGTSVKDDRIALEGCWFDSGVNALSLIKTWLPFDSFCIKDHDVKFADNVGLPIYSRVVLEIDGIKVIVTIDWTQNASSKVSYIKYDNRQIIINHSEQKITDGEKTFCFNSMDRLTRHYFNFFTRKNFQTNYDETKRIHTILCAVRDAYEINHS
ncbi:MAG: Gfo/Idh/MocA family oxidoreductase [Clostridia bacterium]|nr:Gfo/Idh/MocA family oxidoreductase [Clostridia bacterium]